MGTTGYRPSDWDQSWLRLPATAPTVGPMMDFLAIVFGGSAVIIALADLVNTLVSTYTSPGRWWPSQMVGRATFVMIRGVARRLPDESNLKERLLSVFGSLVIIELLLVWAILQVFGFGLIWWGLGDIPTITGLADAWYFSGVVFFTVGFGEIVPTEVIPRAGSILEAFFGVVTIALVVGYLPSLYAAYSDRERTLMMLDAGSTERITPTALIKAWAPDADPKRSTQSSFDGRSGPPEFSKPTPRFHC